ADSGGESADGPDGFFKNIFDAIVKTAGATLPEFESCWRDAVAAPVIGAGNVAIGVFVEEFLKFLLEKLARGDGLGLDGSGGADAGAGGTAVEILIGLGGGGARGGAFD